MIKPTQTSRFLFVLLLCFEKSCSSKFFWYVAVKASKMPVVWFFGFWRMWPWMPCQDLATLLSGQRERTREMTDLTGDLSSTCQPLQGTPLLPRLGWGWGPSSSCPHPTCDWLIAGFSLSVHCQCPFSVCQPNDSRIAFPSKRIHPFVGGRDPEVKVTKKQNP